jgi:hypothetical protein
MIGYIGFGPSYRNTLQYCLHDKKAVQREGESETVVKDRAEVLYYNQCFGNERELIRQFEEVQKLNLNIVKPVLHLSLSLAPEDVPSKGLFVDLARDCARALDFEDHQYVVIRHKDTDNAHAHIVVNRVGFDQHTVVNQYMLRKMNGFCREAEERYELKQTPAMRWYQSRTQRQEPSQDQRVIRLGEVIGEALKEVCVYDDLKRRVEAEGWRVYKTERGIAFKDADRVVVRGWEAGYPWKKIEKTMEDNVLAREQQTLRQAGELRQRELEQQKETERLERRHGLRHHF